MDDLLFSLIQVSIGIKETLSYIPSELEWYALFEMAKKQTVSGICFVGVGKLYGDGDSGPAANLPERLYYEWMGSTIRIQEQNEVNVATCRNLLKTLSDNGIRACILKGSGIALKYCYADCDFSEFRQSGDIDLWVDAPKTAVISFAEHCGITEAPSYLHVGIEYEGLPVELHYRPTYLWPFRKNMILQKFCTDHKSSWENRNDLIVPSLGFNIVYMLTHMFRHVMGSGIGLRQLMDYYFLLRCVDVRSLCDTVDFRSLLKRLGLFDFACAVMWVLSEVFHLETQYMICPMDKKRGGHLLKQVMNTGNFGYMDNDQQVARNTTLGLLKYKICQWSELMKYYPRETLSVPIWNFCRRFAR